MQQDQMVGQVIGGRFRIERLLGMGGMGSVYLAQHTTLPRTFAIKILRPDLARDEALIERFRREAYAASRVEHPHVIYITDFGRIEEGSVYLVMEYVEGQGLDQLLADRGRLSPPQALSIMAQIADALDLAHQVNVIHRDLKPENILLTVEHGRKDFVKLLDFGIAKIQIPEFDGAPLTIRGEVFGTAEYMSPEQASGRPVDGRSDLYALGCLAFELLTGDPPFMGSAVDVLRAHVYNDPPAISDKLPELRIAPALDELIGRCLDKEPANRYQTGAELRQDLLRMRALWFATSDQSMSSSRQTGRRSVLDIDGMAEGWSRLGGKIPALVLPAHGNPEAFELTIPAAPRAVTRSNRQQLQEAYWDVLRELAITLDRWALAPDEASGLLERLLVAEEEIARVRGSLLMAERNVGRVSFEFGQRERRFRHAVESLRQDMGRLKQDPQAAGLSPEQAQEQARDLGFQMEQLSSRCREISQERLTQLQELDQEAEGIRQRRCELEQEVLEIFRQIQTCVEGLRAQAPAGELEQLYIRLDDARMTLDQGRLGDLK